MELHLILLFMIFAAVVAVEAKDLLSSLIGLSAAGLGLSLAFLILKAPSLAITQLVVEILCVIILIHATVNKDLPFIADGRWLFNTVSTFFFISLFLTIAFFAIRELPAFGSPLMSISGDYIASGEEKTGSANLVSAITLGFRSFDVLAETAVFLTAVIGVLAISRRMGKINAK
jgi:multisubunit Na+/H+ antiporter MnhB subunit